MQPASTFLYVADPMCSWCWGFAPVLAKIALAYPKIPIRIVLGGLAPDSDAPMEAEMRAYVQQAWRDVHTRTGAEFNFDFWQKCAPRRSTWPACRAVILTRRHGLEGAMFAAIQNAYYLQARNPSDPQILADLAADLGLDHSDFLRDLQAEPTQAELESDFELRRQLGADSFPSFGLQQDGELKFLHRGWAEFDPLDQAIRPLV
jgi:putative protein-disulfide isomerase